MAVRVRVPLAARLDKTSPVRRCFSFETTAGLAFVGWEVGISRMRIFWNVGLAIAIDIKNEGPILHSIEPCANFKQPKKEIDLLLLMSIHQSYISG